MNAVPEPVYIAALRVRYLGINFCPPDAELIIEWAHRESVDGDVQTQAKEALSRAEYYGVERGTT